jgi:hypothetical protein
MKAVILVFFFLFNTRVWALCLPDSLVFNKSAIFELQVFEQEAKNFEDILLSTIESDHQLLVQFQPLNPRVNAEILKQEKQIIIQVMGGMLKHSRMNELSFKLLLCHEIGHLLGGPPLKSKGGWSSTEGQADYFSGLSCARQLGMGEESFMKAALDLTAIYAEVMKEPYPRLDRCDERRVERTHFGYPSAQCRLDTLMAGWYGQSRPSCWYFE